MGTPKIEFVIDDVQKAPVTIGVLVSIIGGVVLVVSYTVGVAAYVNGTQRQLDNLTTKFDAQQVQRDLTIKNRDLQIDSLKGDVERVSKRQDTADQTLADLVRKMERVLVLTESIDKRLDKDAKP